MEKEETFLTITQLANRWNVAVSKLNRIRISYNFPPFVKRGGIRYPLSEIEKIEAKKDIPYGIRKSE